MVSGTGGRDVEQSEAFEALEALCPVDLAPVGGIGHPLREEDPDSFIVGERQPESSSWSPRTQVGEDADRKLEALGGVHRQDSDGVVVGIGNEMLVKRDLIGGV